MIYQLLDFPIHGDHNGNLIALEKGKDFPFDIRRVYYIWGTKSDIIRGKHAHKNLEQVIVCVAGSCDFALSNGKVKEIVHLDNPSKGLYLKHNIWREFTNFSKDCILMVLASDYYSETDYIRSYDEFLKGSGNV